MYITVASNNCTMMSCDVENINHCGSRGRAEWINAYIKCG